MSAVVIITRFSIRYKGVLPSEEWISYRFDLLKRTSLPSLSQQTVQNLAWVLSTAPEWYDYVSDLFQSVTIPNGVIKVIPQGAGPEGLQDIHPGVEEFITFRFDSDDALASRAIERVLAASAHQEDGEVLFNLPSGIQLDWKTGEMFYRTFKPHYQGPFLAVKNVSRARMLNIGGHHRKTREFFRVVDVPGLNWVQVVHGKNVRNKIRKNVELARVLKWAVEVFRGPQALTADLRRVPRHLHQDLLAEFGIQR
jgi:hypothetical protein